MSTGFEDSDELLEGYLARAGRAAAGSAAGGGRLWREGREVGEWTVAGFLGRGGSAEVYCARHRRLGTAAVLKVLWRGEEGPQERFLLETRFLMESGGGPFPAFYGAGEEDGRPWMAMELLEEYPLPSDDRGAAAYLLDVARAVEGLHRRGWVHRDLKPRNILRRASDGHAVVADFGLLKRIAENPAAETAAERVSPSLVDGREMGVGTPGYAAPEQFAGGPATPATDVHALGMLADECFSGKPPRAWDRIIRRATGSLPRQRYESAAAMARAIRRRHWRRNAAWAGLASALAVALGIWWWAAGREEAPPRMVSPPERPTEQEVPEIPETPTMPEVPEARTTPETRAMSEAEEAVATPEGAEETETGQKPETDSAVLKIPEISEEEGKAQSIAAPEEEEGAMKKKSGRNAGIQAERAAAMARFEADEGRKEIIFSLLDDMQKNQSGRTSWIPTWRGLHEVTQKQWMALMDDNPSRFQGDDLPVDSLTPGACLEFLKRLNATSVAQEGDRKYRLPTAWEWKAELSRQPAETPEDRLASGWFAENADGRTHPVGEKAGVGVCADLYGNVRELTQSWGSLDGKEGFLCMGGSWADAASGEPLSAVLEQPRFVQRFLERYDHADPVVENMPSDYPHAVCPTPGEIGFRLWAEPRETPPNPYKEATKAAIAHWENEAGRR